ncbi:MAG: ATP-binding protein [Gammaproteobacteria bacterium]
MKYYSEIPENEEQRLEALHRYRIIDTEAEEGFDRITRIAAAYFETPIALVSLVDESRQWFKSKIGLDVSETSRDVAFCAHTILDDETMIIADTLSDSRFAESPLVKGDPNIRFYAGAPLRTQRGENLGTLCVIDTVPRTFTQEQVKVLEDLSNLVIDQLELRLTNILAEEELERRTRNIELLRDNQSRLNAIFNTSYDAIVILDETGIIESHNLAASQLFGYSGSELTGLHAKALIPDSFTERAEQFLRGSDTFGADKIFLSSKYNYVGLRKDGTQFPVELSVSASNINNTRFFTVIGRDISAQKRTERKLLSAINIAENSTKSQLELLSSLSHELRTPLNAIIGFSEILSSDIETLLNPAQKQHFQEILNGGKQLTSITKKMLEYARLALATDSRTFEEIPLIPVLEECSQQLSVYANKKQIEVVINSTVKQTFTVHVDKDSLLQVLRKLLTNAIKYSSPKEKVEIDVSVESDQQVLISIRDTGKGIDPTISEHIFEILTRTDSSDSNGIGLALCRAIMQSMHGQITVESELGIGSTFHLTLPRKAPKDSLEAKAQETKSSSSADTGIRQKILYIVDSVTQFKQLEIILAGRKDISVSSAMRGPLGFALAIQNSPDLLLIDMTKDSSETLMLLEQLKTHEKTKLIPIILVGDKLEPALLSQAMNSGINRFVTYREFNASIIELIESTLG